MNQQPRYVTLGDYLAVVRSQRWIIVLTTLIFAAAAYAYSKQQTPVFQSEASLEYSDPFASSPFLGSAAPQAQPAEQRAAIGARRASVPRTALRAKRILRTKEPLGALRAAVSANVEVRSNLVVIQASWSDATFAARLANAFAEAVRERETDDVRAQVQRAARAASQALAELPSTPAFAGARATQREQLTRLRQLAPLAEPVDIVTRAAPASAPVTPRTARNTVIAAFIGLALGLLLAFTRAALDRRLRDARDVVDAAGAPLLGTIQDSALGRTPVAHRAEKTKGLDDLDVEAFRIVRTNIDFLDVDKKLSKVIVTSALPEEGKSTVAAALAMASARVGRRTLLLECDLRAPVMWRRLGLNAGPGMTDFLVGNAAPAEVLQTIAVPHSHGQDGGGDIAQALVCITAGTKVPQPAELLASSRFEQFIEQVGSVYDLVIVDTSPLLPVVDTLELVQYADAIVLCARAHQTTRDELKAAREALARLPERPMGVVVTGLREGEGISYGYYQYGTPAATSTA
jgi:capsular exopolysaccharide synthesis family protein